MNRNHSSRWGYPLALICCIVALGLLFLSPVFAGAPYPDRPIKMIVPWAAGGDTDAICRVIANSMEKHLGKARGHRQHHGRLGDGRSP